MVEKTQVRLNIPMRDRIWLQGEKLRVDLYNYRYERLQNRAFNFDRWEEQSAYVSMANGFKDAYRLARTILRHNGLTPDVECAL